MFTPSGRFSFTRGSWDGAPSVGLTYVFFIATFSVYRFLLSSLALIPRALCANSLCSWALRAAFLRLHSHVKCEKFAWQANAHSDDKIEKLHVSGQWRGDGTTYLRSCASNRRPCRLVGSSMYSFCGCRQKSRENGDVDETNPTRYHIPWCLMPKWKEKNQ